MNASAVVAHSADPDSITDSRPGRRETLLACLILVVTTGVVFWQQVVHPTDLLVGQHRNGRNDLTSGFVGFRLLAPMTKSREGAIPLWNPFWLGGSDWFSNPQSSLCYPPNWLFYVITLPALCSWLMILHHFWAGLGTFLLCRRLRIGFGGSLTGGLIALSAPFLVIQTAEGHFNQIAVISHVPWGFLCLVGLLQGCKSSTVTLPLVMALSFFSGHLQETFYLGLLLGTVFIVALAVRGCLRQSVAADLSRGLVCVLLTLGLICVQLLPSITYSKLSVRGGGMTADEAGQISISPENLRQLVNPFALGDAADYQGAGDFYWETLCYFGVVALLLALLGLVTCWRSPTAWTAGLIFLFTLLFSLGLDAPVFSWCYTTIPGVSLFRAPSRMLFFSSLAIAVLAALGWEMLITRLRQTRWNVVGSGCGLVLGFLVLSEATWFAGRVLGTVPQVQFRSDSDLVAFLKEHNQEGRVLVPQNLLSDYEAFKHGLHKVQGYDPVPLTASIIPVAALVPEQDVALVAVGFQSASPAELDQSVADLLQVRYVVTPEKVTPVPQGWREVKLLQIPAAVTLRDIQPELLNCWIYENESYSPGSFLIGQVKLQQPEIKLHTQLQQLQPEEQVLLKQDVLPDGPRTAFQPVQITSLSPNRLQTNVELTQPGYLVISETWHPGWQATVNGQQVPVLVANGAFRAIPLGPGQHSVELKFRPPTFAIGGVCSLLCLGLVFSVLFIKPGDESAKTDSPSSR